MALSGGATNETISLAITPMLDIFSILVTFLLMSYSSDPISHDPNPALELPDSRTTVSLDEIPSVVVSKNEILVNDKKVVTVIGGEVDNRHTTQGAIYPLFQELLKLNTINKNYIDESNSRDRVSTLTLEMDKNHKFELLKMIMLSAQQAKFITFKLLVSKEKS